METLTIKDLHEDLEKASEEILKAAKRIIEEADRKVIKTYVRLYKMGFRSSKITIEAAKTAKQIIDAKQQLRLQRIYEKEYPNLIFLTQEKVNNICMKYGLCLGDADYFIEDIPYPVAVELASFDRIKPEHLAYYRVLTSSFGSSHTVEITYYQYLKYKINPNISVSVDTKLKVIAPRHAFKKDMNYDGFRLKPKIIDPIVLHPVRGGYLVLAAWGDEEEIIRKEVL